MRINEQRAKVSYPAGGDAVDDRMQIVAHAGIIAFQMGNQLRPNPYDQSEPLLQWAFETGWREAAYVAAEKGQAVA